MRLHHHSSTSEFSNFKFHMILIALAVFSWTLPTMAQNGDFSSVMITDHLNVVTRAPGVPENSIFAGFENNESVSLFNGNLLISHPATPSYSLDGGGSIGLSRVYNSKNAAFERYRSTFDINSCSVSNGYALNADSWIGFGWDMHLGRLFTKSTRSALGCDAGVFQGYKFFEDAQGTQIRWYPEAMAASPILKVVLHVAVPAVCIPTCPPECGGDPFFPGCNNCEEDCIIVTPGEPEHYTVKYPNGTEYYLEELVPDQLTGEGHTLNHGRNGWYTTKITDVHDNTTWIYYGECVTGGESCVRGDQCATEGDTCDLGIIYPESIRSIQIQRTGEASPVEVIRTELWVAGDTGDVDWHPGAVGRLKYLETLGPNGVFRSHKYVYASATSTTTDDDDIVINTTVDVLSRVDLPVVNGASAGSVTMAYNNGKGNDTDELNTAYAPMLQQIDYPLGGRSVHEYSEYSAGVWVMEVPPASPFNNSGVTKFIQRLRKDFGVSKRTIYPDGPTGSHYSWKWARENGVSDLTTGILVPPCTSETQNFTMTDPAGRVSKTLFGGSPCGAGYSDGLEGFPIEEITYVNGDPTAARLRTVERQYRSEPTTHYVFDHVKKRILENETVAIFEDDIGGCFGAGGSGPAKRMTTSRHQLDSDDPSGEDGWYFWRVTRREGDYLTGRRLVYTHYLDPDETPGTCQQTKHVLGTYDYQFLREGESPLNRVDREYTFGCEGQLTQLDSIQDWNTDTSVPADWEDWNPGAPPTTGVTRLTSSHDYLTNGNLQRLDFSGGDNYPDGSSSNTYSADFTWQLGMANTLQVGNSSEFPYLSQDVTLDAAGFVTSKRDPNSLQKTLSYDTLGRLTQITPPGIEHASRIVYPDLKTTRVIQSPGSETAHDPNDTGQIYTEQQYDGLGRLTESLKAMPDGTLAHQVRRYDPMGRMIFVSEWLSASDYSAAMGDPITWDVDLDGVGGVDYWVVVPKEPASGVPWGTTTFYGAPAASPDEDNPLRATPDGLGRVQRITQADGSAVDTSYCGPHKEVTTYYNACPMPCDTAVNWYYHDGLGRLAVVDTPAGGVDAEYRYDPLGNLIKVNLIQDAAMPADPFEAWKDDTFTDGQVRTFSYNAAGRLESATNPENGTTTYGGYDVWGNLLTYQDALATQRGYHFKNTYDNAGRLTKTERVRGTPADPQPTDVPRVSAASASFDDMADWTEGTITADTFSPGPTPSWTDIYYSSLSCISAPPDGGGTKGLYMGMGCRYSSVPATAQALRAHLIDVTRDDVISFKFWRHVREGGTGSKDILSVFVVDATVPTDDTTSKKVLFQMDDSDPSFKTWRRTQAMRPGDYFDASVWPDDVGSTLDLYLYVVFEKGDILNPGMSAGVFLDDFFVGRHGVETLAENVFDADACVSGAAGDACIFAGGGVNRFLGQLSEQRSYHDDRLIATKLFAYKGLNGRLSGEANLIDWAGVGQTDNFVVRHDFNSHGLQDTWRTFLEGVEENRIYSKSYRRGMLTGLEENLPYQDLPFLVNGSGVEYTGSGLLKAISFHSGARQTITPDLMNRPSSIQVLDKGAAMLWDSGTYQYDASGNIIAIGNETYPVDGDQQYTYDAHGRLVSAIVFGQARGVASAASPFTVGYSYDEYGNMSDRTWDDGATTPIPPPGLVFSGKVHTDNRIVSDDPPPLPALPHVFAYDHNGNMTRLPSASNPAEHATWDAQNRMLAYARAGNTIERYLYDAQGYRVLRYPEDEKGAPVISIRTGKGRMVSQYRRESDQADPTLDKDFLYGAGRLLVERKVSGVVQTVSTPAGFYGSNQYSFVVTAGDDGGPYTVDIRTASGTASQLTGVTLDGNGEFNVNEALFSTTEPNFVRIRSESAEAALYSAPVSLVIDPTVDANSENQVMAMAVSREGNTVTVRWRFHTSNSDSLNLYYTPDGGSPVLLTTLPLLSGVKEYAVQTQALATNCIDFGATQLPGSGETGSSALTPLPNPFGGQDISINDPPCPDPTPPPPPPLVTYSFSDTMQHRDHLGTLRVATDVGGWLLSEHDFYPFGLEITPDDDTDVTGGSRMRFTGHQRDVGTGLDYMMARYCGNTLARFTSVDPAMESVFLRAPQTWNRYAYVVSSPTNAVDPDGRVVTWIARKIAKFFAKKIVRNVGTQSSIGRDEDDPCWGGKCGPSQDGAMYLNYETDLGLDHTGAWPPGYDRFADQDGDGIPNLHDPDIDGDGIPNTIDPQPLTPDSSPDGDTDGDNDNSEDDPKEDDDPDGNVELSYDSDKDNTNGRPITTKIPWKK